MSNIVAPKLTDITAMFNSCSVLETVDFRGIDTSKLTNSSSVFNDVNGAKIYVSRKYVNSIFCIGKCFSKIV